MTESVAIEFDMIPAKQSWPSPETLDELFIDLRVQGDAVGVYTPEMDVKLIIGQVLQTLIRRFSPSEHWWRNRSSMGRYCIES